MLIRRNLFNRLISLMLVVSILLMTVGCSNAPPTPTISDANPQTVKMTIISSMQGLNSPCLLMQIPV